MVLSSSAESKVVKPAGLVGRCALLLVVLAVTAVLVAAAVHRGFSPASFMAAAIACGVCWLGASLALVATYGGNVLGAPVQGMLVSMIGRIGVPLASLVLLPRFGGPVAAPGVMNTILGVYLVALVAETILALQLVRRSPGAQSPGVPAPGSGLGSRAAMSPPGAKAEGA